MGICYSDLWVYWQEKLRGVSFSTTITIGHQNLFLSPIEVKLLRRSYYKEFPDSKIDPFAKLEFGVYADDVLCNLLGIQNLSSIDYSPYEGAIIIHDLNLTIPQDVVGRFDVVIENGSLEHIFNFPIAMSNIMKMAKIGGKLFITIPANNFCGHGFYQFGPELMLKVFVQDNGFRLEKILFCPAKTDDFMATSNRCLYELIDPAKITDAVQLISKRPLLMIVEATRVADVPIFTHTPLQSYYVTLWNSDGSQHQLLDSNKLLENLYNRMPSFVQSTVKTFYSNKRISRRNSLSNSKVYNKLQI
jgi:SAM-dependent methyltransferase